MADHEPITGNQVFDRDLYEFFAMVDDPGMLATAKQAVSDESLEIQQLNSRISPSVVSVILTLLDEEVVAAIASGVEEGRPRRTLQRAAELAREHFARLYHHPAIMRELRRRLDQQSSHAEDKEGRINAVFWLPNWQESNGKLSPAGLLQLRDRADKVLLTSPLDWDDVAFLVAALSRQLASHMEKSKPILDANLLTIPDAEPIARRIREASQNLAKIREVAVALGLEVADTTPGKDS